MKRWIGPLFLTAAIVYGIVYLLKQSAEAREVAMSAGVTIFGFFTTPFVLESTVGLLGLVTVMSYNQWRLSKEGDEWVEMEVEDPVPADSAAMESK